MKLNEKTKTKTKTKQKRREKIPIFYVSGMNFKFETITTIS